MFNLNYAETKFLKLLSLIIQYSCTLLFWVYIFFLYYFNTSLACPCVWYLYPIQPSGCLHVYQTLQAKYDSSARIRVGVAKCLDSLSKEANSNRLLEFAIYAYRRALKLPLKEKLFRYTTENLISRLRFRGQYSLLLFIIPLK